MLVVLLVKILARQIMGKSIVMPTEILGSIVNYYNTLSKAEENKSDGISLWTTSSKYREKDPRTSTGKERPSASHPNPI